MLPLLASVIRPPIIPGMSNNVFEQTQDFLRLVCQQKHQQLLLHHHQQQQQQLQRQQHQQQHIVMPRLKRELEDKDEQSSSPAVKKATSEAKDETSKVKNTCSDWSVDQVCKFVSSVELCKPYVEVSTIKTY